MEDAELLRDGGGPAEEHVSDEAEQGKVGFEEGGKVGAEGSGEGVLDGVVETGDEWGREGEGGIGVRWEAVIGGAEGEAGEADGRGEAAAGEVW